MAYTARPFVAQEASYRQLQDLKPNLAVLPWGATEAHNYHMPHGTDNIQAQSLADAAASQANEQGARCVVLPCVPFGNNNSQPTQVATITMTTAMPMVIIQPKSMTGRIPLTNRDAKATIVVTAVNKQGMNLSLMVLLTSQR